MAINKKDTNELKVRFKDFFEQDPEVVNENQHGCDRIVIRTKESINLNQLNHLMEGVGNTVTLSSKGGNLRIAVW